MLIRFLKINSILILLFYGINLAQDCKANVILISDIPGGGFYIGDKYICQDKIELQLEKGKHIVTLKEKRIWNSNFITDTLFIDDCNRSYTFHFKTAENIVVDSKPQNVSVYSNNELVGYTPMLLPENSIKNLSLRMNNVYKSNIINNGRIHVEFDKQLGNENNSFVKSNLFKWLIGGATVLGVTTAYFKLQADKKYDDYKLSKDKSLLDQIDRYDLYSGIALGLLQINFGYLLYCFLTD